MSQFNIPSSGRQVFIAELLERQRAIWLQDAVLTAAKSVPPSQLRTELNEVVPANAFELLGGADVADELVFATPSVLRHSPSALAYYRLLLGVSQKQFYQSGTGLNVFRSMEDSGRISLAARNRLSELCIALNGEIAKLIATLPTESISSLVRELPLVTFGAQADGSWRNAIGAKATTSVFDALKEIVRASNRNCVETPTSISVLNNSNREVLLMLAPDPDIVVRERFNPNEFVYKAAIEIKGGTDYSNLHNRVGEAEKSHQKARAAGAGDCWTIIDLRAADLERIRQESPSTREWFDLSEVLNQSGTTWDRLVQVTRAAMGI